MKKLFPFFLLLLSACELVVEVNVPYDPYKMALNGLQRLDSTWYVEVTHTKPITGQVTNGYNYIPEATVIVHSPDGTSEKLQVDAYGAFHGVGYPKPGETYRITVDAPNMESAEAQTTIPAIVPIVDVKWDSTTVAEQTSQPYYYYVNVPFKVTFRDPQDTKNYYGVQTAEMIERTLLDFDGNEVIDTLWRVRDCFIEDDPGIAAKDEHRIYFPDNTFSGRSYTAHLTAQFLHYPYPVERVLKIYVQLLTLSEDYYRYLETRNLQYDTKGNPFAQPVQVHSNVSNGFGIFAGYAIDVRKWEYH